MLRLDPACLESREDLPAGPQDAERLRRHREACAACREHQKTVFELRLGIEAAERPLDELSRARIEARIFKALDEKPARPNFDLRRAAPWAVAAAAVLALVFPRDPQPVMLSAPVISPLMISGFEAPPAVKAALSGAPLSRIDVAAEGVADLEIGSAALRLLGAGTIATEAAPLEVTRLLLQSGLLLCDVEPRDGRQVVVAHSAAEIVVSGTRFAADARVEGRLVVGVSEGVVQIGEARVAAGQAWIEGEGVAELPRELADLLAGWIVPRAAGPTGILSIPNEDNLPVEVRRLSGKTPLEARLEPGKYWLTVGGVAHEVEIAAGKTTVVEDEPDTSQAPPPLEIQSPRQPIRRDDAEALYKKAEAAMAKNDFAKATEQLRAVIDRFTQDPLASAALYELARLELQNQGDRAKARDYLERLSARDTDPSLAEAARHLLCRLQTEDGQTTEAMACWSDFREQFPQSAHDRAALRVLIGLSDKTGGCGASRPWLEKFVATYPSDPFAAEASQRLERCAE